MLEEDHKVEESCAAKNNKEAFSVSLDYYSELCRCMVPVCLQLGGVTIGVSSHFCKAEVLLSSTNVTSSQSDCCALS